MERWIIERQRKCTRQRLTNGAKAPPLHPRLPGDWAPLAHAMSRELEVRRPAHGGAYPSRRPANRAASRRVISGHFRYRESDKFKLGLDRAPRKAPESPKRNAPQ